MNAATVSGPRSRITSTISSAIRNPISAMSSFFLDRNEGLSTVAPYEDPRDPARRHLAELARRFGRVRDGLAVDRQDDIALPQETGRGAVLIDVRDHGARLPRRQSQPPRQLRVHVVQRQAEAARALGLRLGLIRL